MSNGVEKCVCIRNDGGPPSRRNYIRNVCNVNIQSGFYNIWKPLSHDILKKISSETFVYLFTVYICALITYNEKANRWKMC